MYKIFGNSHLLLLASEKEKNFLVENGARMFKSIPALVKEIKRNDLDLSNQVLAVTGADTHAQFTQFAAAFTRVNAGGGLVYNQQHKLLLIFRKGHWDLPKGKQDTGESISACALREVKEECGIKKLKLAKKLTHTYHYYYMHQTWQLKKTSWFKMSVPGTPKLIPQHEEGISKVIWAGEKEVKQSLKKTFPLIHDLLLNYSAL